MRRAHRLGTLWQRLGLTRQVALLSLLPMIALGFLLARVLQSQVTDRTLLDATRSARIIANLGVQPELSPQAMSRGLSAQQVAALDRRLSVPEVGRDLARIKVWNSAHRIVYSEDHTLIGRSPEPSDDLLEALGGHPQNAKIVDPSKDSETASEVGLGELIEVYVPLRFARSGPPAGAFEIYLSYSPVAASVTSDKRTIALLIAIGLALLWAALYRIVGRASRRLRRQARENHRLARSDTLTGLANRTRFVETLAGAASRTGANGTLAVLLIDLERFTAINNTLGAGSGDEVLSEVARRLRETFPDALAARLGGDEFAVLLADAAGTAGALAGAEAVVRALEPPVLLEQVALDVEASVGVAVLGEHAGGAQSLLAHADLALAHARSQGGRIEIYSPELERSDPGRLRLLGEVRGALAAGQFTLRYQPQVDLRTRRITGVEALVRWEHPEHGELAPDRFIGLIEQTALIGPLTLSVVDQALAQAAAWRRRGIRLQMSVNLSARNLLDTDLPERVGALLRTHEVPAEQLVVEVTESATMADPQRAVRVLTALRESGVGISVDDFGTGNASIEYLADLPASELKIDRSFITEIDRHGRDQAIVRATIDLARNLGLQVVAEGIETEATVELLSELGCTTGQGYLFARPLPAAELTPQLVAAFGLGGAELRTGSAGVFGPPAA